MPKRILIIEDDPDIRYILGLVLEEKGFEVEILSEGKNVLEGNYTIPDLILLDKRLPDIDGADLCKHLKAQETTKHIRVVMVSASPKLCSVAEEVCADHFIEKPFKISDLLKVVAKYMNEPAQA